MKLKRTYYSSGVKNGEYKEYYKNGLFIKN